jgi:hypothetical protein
MVITRCIAKQDGAMMTMQFVRLSPASHSVLYDAYHDRAKLLQYISRV